MANTLDYINKVLIAIVKSFVVQRPVFWTKSPLSRRSKCGQIYDNSCYELGHTFVLLKSDVDVQQRLDDFIDLFQCFGGI